MCKLHKDQLRTFINVIIKSKISIKKEIGKFFVVVDSTLVGVRLGNNLFNKHLWKVLKDT